MTQARMLCLIYLEQYFQSRSFGLCVHQVWYVEKMFLRETFYVWLTFCQRTYWINNFFSRQNTANQSLTKGYPLQFALNIYIKVIMFSELSAFFFTKITDKSLRTESVLFVRSCVSIPVFLEYSGYKSTGVTDTLIPPNQRWFTRLRWIPSGVTLLARNNSRTSEAEPYVLIVP